MISGMNTLRAFGGKSLRCVFSAALLAVSAALIGTSCGPQPTSSGLSAKQIIAEKLPADNQVTRELRILSAMTDEYAQAVGGGSQGDQAKHRLLLLEDGISSRSIEIEAKTRELSQSQQIAAKEALSLLGSRFTEMKATTRN